MIRRNNNGKSQSTVVLDGLWRRCILENFATDFDFNNNVINSASSKITNQIKYLKKFTTCNGLVLKPNNFIRCIVDDYENFVFRIIRIEQTGLHRRQKTLKSVTLKIISWQFYS